VIHLPFLHRMLRLPMRQTGALTAATRFGLDCVREIKPSIGILDDSWAQMRAADR
jgi:hypothetical protein